MNDMTVQSSFRPSNGEAPFGIDEVFFSRTDERGVIEAGNAVFRRVADFEWDKLIGAPHKIIRHPDMPKAVFRLLWDTIQSGAPVGAYVKNRASDGLYYWVFAIVTPISGGYLSVRIKPTSGMFETVRAEYADLLEAEKGGRDPGASAAALLDRLKALGFESYVDFMSQALAAEWDARNKACGRREDPLVGFLKSVVAQLTEVRDMKSALTDMLAAVMAVPSNMRIMASRIEPAGGPITAISGNYKTMSSELTASLDHFIKGEKDRCVDHLDRVRGSLFAAIVARVQAETITQYSNERADGSPADPVGEMERLKDQKDQFTTAACQCLKEISQEVAVMARIGDELRRMVVGLDSIRVMCRVESGRLRVQSAGLATIIETLDRVHSKIDQQLEAIVKNANHVGVTADGALRSLRSAHDGTAH